jgi:hypothetical protein
MLNHYFFELFPQDDKEYQLTWLDTVKKNTHVEKSFVISVYFREIIHKENKDQFRNLTWAEQESAIKKFSLDLPMGAIPVLRLGSIWKNGKIIGVVDNEKLFVKGVKFNKEINPLVRATASYSDAKYYIPRYLYPLSDNAWKTNILVFPNEYFNDSTITHFVLPSTEVFRAEYTNSSNLTELLLCGNWADTDNGIFNPNESWFNAETNTHCIQLRQKVLNVDAPLVARFYFSQYAQRCLDNFHNNLQKSLIEFKEAGIWCYPPFEDAVDLVVHGQTLKTRDREIFLIYWIESSTSPFPFKNLIRGRDNDSSAVRGTDVSSLKPYTRSPKKKRKEKGDGDDRKPKPISTTQEKSKMTSTIWENYTCSRFLNLEDITISKKEKEEQTHHGFPQIEIDSAFIYSLDGGGYGVNCLTPLGISNTLKTLDPTLTDKKRKTVSISLEEIKDGLQKLSERDDISVNFIQLYSHLSYKFEDTSFVNGQKAWCFIDGKAGTQRRKILAAEINTKAGNLYLLEMERRKTPDGVDKEEYSTLLIAATDFRALDVKELEEFVDSCIIKERWVSDNEIIHFRRKRLKHTFSNVEEFLSKLLDDIYDFIIDAEQDTQLTDKNEVWENVIPFPKAA